MLLELLVPPRRSHEMATWPEQLRQTYYEHQNTIHRSMLLSN